MKTKNIFSKILMGGALMLSAALSSCSTDSLDIEQHGTDGVNTYKTADDTQVKQYIAAVYAMTMGDAYQSRMAGGQASYRALLFEFARMGGETANEYPYNEDADARTYSYIWSYFYKQAYWCNMIIENLPENNVASESVKNQVIAEARAIRAIAMMNLVQLYGNPPLADHILNGEEGNTPAAESWAWIEIELNAAAEALPTKSGLDGQKAIGGRLTREAVYAYLGKAQLWQKKYNEAAQTLYNKVIATGKYALVDDFHLINSSAGDFSSENIWEFDFNEEPANAGAQEGCFDITAFAPNVVWFHTYAFAILQWGGSAYPTAAFANFMQAHDGEGNKRYDETFMSAAKASTMGMITYPLGECVGYINVKDVTLAEDLTGVFPYYYSLRNLVYMRYAEVLLNYAEAVAQGGNAGAMSGLEALNLVRRRAGLEDAPALDMNNADYGVKAERRAELYKEGSRFIDLVRWGDAATELANCGKESYMLQGINDDGTYNVTSSLTGGNGFKSGKNELFPIPSTDVNTNPNLTQNPGW